VLQLMPRACPSEIFFRDANHATRKASGRKLVDSFSSRAGVIYGSLRGACDGKEWAILPEGATYTPCDPNDPGHNRRDRFRSLMSVSLNRKQNAPSLGPVALGV
jgi:hypothetical protein